MAKLTAEGLYPGSSHTLPRILVPANPRTSSISMVRALKQALEMLEHVPATNDPAIEDALAASIDDLEVMLECITKE